MLNKLTLDRFDMVIIRKFIDFDIWHIIGDIGPSKIPEDADPCPVRSGPVRSGPVRSGFEIFLNVRSGVRSVLKTLVRSFTDQHDFLPGAELLNPLWYPPDKTDSC